MKSPGIQCSSPQQQEVQHAFLFSLRSLDPHKRRTLDISINLSSNIFQSDSSSVDSRTTKSSIFDPSTLLPLFSKGSQPQFRAFLTASEHTIFQQENKTIMKKLCVQVEAKEQTNQQIMEARPRSNYCQICKETFSDYLKHLSHPIHIKKFEAQSKNTMIDNLLKSLENQNKGIRRPRRRVDKEQAEQHNMPCKVRVIQMQDTLTPMRINSYNQSNFSLRKSLSTETAPEQIK